MGEKEETKHRVLVNKWCFGHHRAFPREKEGAAVPRCRCAGRCPPGRGALLRTSSGQSACKCKQCLPFAEEAPCQQRVIRVSRCSNMCKIRKCSSSGRTDLEWGQEDYGTQQWAPYLGVRTLPDGKLHHPGIVPIFRRMDVNFQMDWHLKMLRSPISLLWFSSCLFCECCPMLRMFI